MKMTEQLFALDRQSYFFSRSLERRVVTEDQSGGSDWHIRLGLQFNVGAFPDFDVPIFRPPRRQSHVVLIGVGKLRHIDSRRLVNGNVKNLRRRITCNDLIRQILS